MHRQRLLSLFAPILMIIGLMLSLAGVASAAPQTLTILGASGLPGSTDPYTEFSRDNGATWQQAYLYSGHPWGQIPGTNAWINCAPSGNACEYETVLYRIRFVVPGGWSNPRMAFDVKADNHAWISVNGGPTTHVEGQNSFNIDETIASTLRTGMNEIQLTVKDDGGWIGFNYKITLTLDAPTPPSTLPGGQLPPPDTTPPTITATVTPPANANGWHNTDVQIGFDCADTQSDVPSCPAPVPVTTEGTGQSYTATASDTAGNTGSVTVSGINIDRTAPVTSISAATGWQNKDVPVTFTATDNLSGVAATYYTVDGGAPQTGTSLSLATEGVHTLTYWSVDTAGNAEAQQTATIQIDKTAPTITGAADRAANASGWYKADVTVTLAATDNLSGVATTEYNRDGAGWVAYTTAILIHDEGVHTLQYRSVDKAGNVEPSQTLTVRVDKTAPEAYLQFDPLTHQLQLFGQDALSGVTTTGPITPVSVTRPKSGDRNSREDDRNKGGDDRNKGGEYGELRTYLVKDSADNTLQVVVGVKAEGSQIKASVISLQYSGGKLIAPLLDGLSFDWSAGKESKSKELQQQLTTLTGSSRRSVNAHFDARKNVTVIQTGEPGASAEGNGNGNENDHKGGERPGQVTLPGMVLLRMTTSQGALVIEVPGL